MVPTAPAHVSMVTMILTTIRNTKGQANFLPDLGSTAVSFESSLLCLWGTNVPPKHKDEVVQVLRDLAEDDKCTPVMALALIGLAHEIEMRPDPTDAAKAE